MVATAARNQCSEGRDEDYIFLYRVTEGGGMPLFGIGLQLLGNETYPTY